MSHDDKNGEAFVELLSIAAVLQDAIEHATDESVEPRNRLQGVIGRLQRGLALSAIGASAEKAMDRIVENSREQIEEAARNMGKAAVVGLGVGPIPAPVSHDADTKWTNRPWSTMSNRERAAFNQGYEAGISAASARSATVPSGWQPIDGNTPTDRMLLGVVDGSIRFIKWGKTSHVPLHGWCLADQGVEDFDLCEPTHWMPMPMAPTERTAKP